MALNQIRGRNLSAPTQMMEFDGEKRRLVFDMNCFRIAEDVYEDQYGRDKNFAEIAMELSKGKLGAIMAVYYAGLVSGGLEITWPNFAAVFKLTDIPGVREQLAQLVADALPDPEDADGKEDKSDPLGRENAEESSRGDGSGTQP